MRLIINSYLTKINKTSRKFFIMLLIVGLGNKGNEFINTPHNIGREMITLFVKNHQFNCFSLNKKLRALISKNGDVIFALPQCFMNESGEIVKKLVNYFGISLQNLLIVHDDADIKLGKIKIQKNRNAAGHKGVISIIHYLRSKNFWRLRIGIRTERLPSEKAKELVLKKFNKEENKILAEIVPRIFKSLDEWVAKIEKSH